MTSDGGTSHKQAAAAQRSFPLLDIREQGAAGSLDLPNRNDQVCSCCGKYCL